MKSASLMLTLALSLTGCEAYKQSVRNYGRPQQVQQRQAVQTAALQAYCLTSTACLAGLARGSYGVRPYRVSVRPLGGLPETLHVYPQPSGSARVCDLLARCVTVTPQP